MAQERPEDLERGFFAQIGDTLGGWWRKQTPAERRKSVFQIFLCILVLAALIGGCQVVRSYTTEKRQETERQNLPGVAGAPGAPSSAESARGALPGGTPAAPGAKAAAGGASSPAAPATSGKAADARGSLPGVK